MNDSRIPQQLGDYEILREVGAGGMGMVFEARQRSLDKLVAVKVLPLGGFSSRSLRARFRIESRAMAQLEHPHIVPVWDVGCEQGFDYFVMQFVDGADVAKLIQGLRQMRSGSTVNSTASGDDETVDLSKAPSNDQLSDHFVLQTPSPDGSSATVNVSELLSTKSGSRSRSSMRLVRTVADMVMRVADALHHAHELQIVHRDVKPSNLLLDHHGHVWLSDFGLARVGDETGLTIDGDLLGTIRYMSPEQAMSRVTVDHRTDIYSLGATLYELLTLDPAHPGANRQEILQQVSFADPVPPARRDATIPRELSTITMKALAKSPDDRYQTAKEMADDLRAFLEDRAIKAQPPNMVQRASRWVRRHRQLAASLAAGAVLAICGLSIALALTIQAKQRTTKALETEKAAKAKVDAALNESEGLRKAAQASIRVDEDPGVAHRLAEAALQQHPSVESRNALLNALDEGHEIRSLQPSGRVVSADIAPDRSRGITVTEVKSGDAYRRQLTLWNLRDAKVDRELKPRHPVDQAFFSSDSTRLISISTEESGYRPVMWDALSGKALWPPADEEETWTAPRFQPRSLNPSGDAALVFDVRRPKETAVIDLLSRRPQPPLRCEAAVKIALFLADDRIATADVEGNIIIWDRGGNSVAKFAAPRRNANTAPKVEDLKLDRKSNTLLLVADQRVTVWNAQNGKRGLSREWRGRAAAWLNQGREFVVLSSLEPRMSIHNRQSGRTMHRMKLENRSLFAVSPDQARIVALKAPGEVGVWDTMTGEQTQSLLRKAKIRELRFVDSDYLVSHSGLDVTLWHRLPGADRHTLPIGAGAETRPLVAFSPHAASKNHPLLATSTLETQVINGSDDEAQVSLRGAPRGAEVNRDGFLVTVVAPEETGVLWKLPSNSPIAKWPLPDGRWTQLGCSHDGHFMGGIVDGETGVFRNVREGAQWQAPGATQLLAFHPDQPRAVTVNDDGDVFIWDLQQEIAMDRFTKNLPLRDLQMLKEEDQMVGLQDDRVVRLSYEGEVLWQSDPISPQSLMLVEAQDRIVAFQRFPQGVLQVLDLESGKQLTEHEMAVAIDYVASDHKDPVVLVASREGVLHWNYETDEQRQLFDQATRRVVYRGKRAFALTQFGSHPFRWKPTDKRATSDIVELDTETGEVVQTLKSPDRRRFHLMPLGEDGVLAISQTFGWARFHPRTLAMEAKREDHAAPVSDLISLPKRKQVVLSSWDGSITVYDAEDRLVRRFGALNTPILDLAADEASERIATGTADGRVIVWDFDGQQIAEAPQHPSPVISIEFGQNGSRLAVLYKDQRAAVFQIIDNQMKDAATTLEKAVSIHLSGVSPNWFAVVNKNADHQLLLYSDDPENPTAFNFARIQDAKISPVGDVIAIIDERGEIRLIDVQLGKETKRLKGHANIYQLVFSADGRFLLANGADVDPEVWDVSTGKQHVVLGHWGDIHISHAPTTSRNATMFSPDGRMVFTMRGKDRRVRMWPLELSDAAKRLAPFE